MSRIPPPQHDPGVWPQVDEWIASVIRENEELKKEISELRAGVPSVDRTDSIEVFWSYADRSGGANACWPWKRCLFPHGYGNFRGRKAHRVAYELTRGPVPIGLVLDHACGNRECVNPEHLEAVTPRVNVLRGGPGVAGRRLRDKGLCVQCHKASETYRCERCRLIHNATDKQRPR